jgi:raffinose/stachyose/melibiose transport system substrate-binding protein
MKVPARTILLLTWLRSYCALGLIVAAFAWAAFRVCLGPAQTNTNPQTITLHISHFQLEPSVRDAFDQLAADYRRDVNPNVRIVQEAIPDGLYGQWCSSQLVGGTAPDLMEIGYGRLAHSVWISYFNRYYIPLTVEASRPNPHNRGTDLEGVPLRQTYADGMRFGYCDELQEVMTVPMAQFSVRVFYNRDLLHRLTGLTAPPTNYRAFLQVCDRIASRHIGDGSPYVPIASSAYHFTTWDNAMFNPLTYSLLGKADFNRDGTVGSDETFAAFKTRAISFDDPAIAAKFKLQHEVMGRFQSGFSGMTRDEAVFLFAQQRAVFISTGTWDAQSLTEQARDAGFNLGVMNFPMPDASDPEFGSLMCGPVFDRTGTAFPMAVTRFSQHPDVATDFLLYLASKKGNERFNQIVGWIPVIRGSAMPAMLRGFEPQLQGMYPAWDVGFGGDTTTKWSQLTSLFNVGLISYSEMAREFLPYYLSHGTAEWKQSQHDWRRAMVANEQMIAADRGLAMTQPVDAESNWVRYRVILQTRLLGQELTHDQMVRRVEGKLKDSAGPYELSAAATANLRAALAKLPTAPDTESGRSATSTRPHP